jgi:23S rRNA (adenine2503-C2)-methyltransferase
MTQTADQGSSRLVRLDAGEGAEVSARAAELGPQALFGLDGEELAEVMVAAGKPRWRGRQLAEAIYSQRVAEISSISTLSKDLREKLVKAGWAVGRPRIAQVFTSVDGTERYLV